MSQTNIRSILDTAWHLDGSHLAASLPSCLWQSLLDKLWTHAVALSPACLCPCPLLLLTGFSGGMLDVFHCFALFGTINRLCSHALLTCSGTASCLERALPVWKQPQLTVQGTGRPSSTLTLWKVIQSIKSTIFLEVSGILINPWNALFKTMGVIAVCKMSPSLSLLRFPTKCRTLSALQQKWESPGMPGTVQGSLLIMCATSAPSK